MENSAEQERIRAELEKSFRFMNAKIENLYIGNQHINRAASETQAKAKRKIFQKKAKKKNDKSSDNEDSDKDDSSDDTSEDSDDNDMVILNDETIKTPCTLLERILSVHEKIEEYCGAKMDFEALGYLQTIHKFGKSVSMLPAYVNYYDTVLKTDRGNEAEAIFEKIYSILIEKIQVTFKECYKQAEKFRLEKKYFKSILFHLIGGSMLLREKDADRLLTGAQGFMLGVKMCILKIDDECSHFCETVKSFILPKVRYLQRSIFNLDIAKSKKDVVLVEALCLHHLQISEEFSNDIEVGELTLTHTQERLHAVLGEEATKCHLYATTLNNLGAIYIQTRRYDDAQRVLLQALEVIQNVTDYDSEDKRNADLARSKSALNSVQEITDRASFLRNV